MATFSTVLVKIGRSLCQRARFLVVIMSVFMCTAFSSSQASTENPTSVNTASATSAWAAFLPTPKPVGEGQLRRWGFLIYDATLWSSNGKYESTEPFALRLSYARTVSRDQIVDASLDQMHELGIDVAQHPDWSEKLRQVFEDVTKGDSLTGIYMPGKGAVFFYNNRLTGQIDEALARAFFSIWLDPQTTEPDLRLSLLGLAQ
jgi:hypothetical protein